MSASFNINDKAELEMARFSLRGALSVALPIVLLRTHPAFHETTKHRLEQRWAMINTLIDQQIARIDREAASEFRTHGDDSAVDDEMPPLMLVNVGYDLASGPDMSVEAAWDGKRWVPVPSKGGARNG